MGVVWIANVAENLRAVETEYWNQSERPCVSTWNEDRWGSCVFLDPVV